MDLYNNSIKFRGADGGSIDIGDGDENDADDTDGGNSEDGKSASIITHNLCL